MSIGTSTVASLAQQALSGGMGDVSTIVGAWFPTGDPGGGATTALGEMGMLFGLKVNQLALVVSTLANSPTQPWSSFVGTAGPAKKLAALQNLLALMKSKAATKSQGSGGAVQDPTVNLLTWIPDGVTRAVSGGDLTTWLGANVA